MVARSTEKGRTMTTNFLRYHKDGSAGFHDNMGCVEALVEECEVRDIEDGSYCISIYQFEGKNMTCSNHCNDYPINGLYYVLGSSNDYANIDDEMVKNAWVNRMKTQSICVYCRQRMRLPSHMEEV